MRQVLLILLALFVPPVSVLVSRGLGVEFVLNLLLTLLGIVPGQIHAIYLLVRHAR